MLSSSSLFPATAEFRGSLAGPGAAGRARSGFAGMTVQLGDDEAEGERSRRKNSGEKTSSSSSSPPFSSSPLDLSAFDALRLRVRNGDGRPWVVSLRTENWLVGDAEGGGCHDVWQAFLFAPDARRTRSRRSSGSRSRSSTGFEDETFQESESDGWSTAELPLSRFLLTHRGRLVEARVSMNAARVVSLGLAPAPLPSFSSGGGGEVVEENNSDDEAPEGAFCLGLESISAFSTSRGLLTRVEAEKEEAWRERERKEGVKT